MPTASRDNSTVSNCTMPLAALASKSPPRPTTWSGIGTVCISAPTMMLRDSPHMFPRILKFPFREDETCVCLDQVECLAPWEDVFDTGGTSNPIPKGTLYTKPDIDVCTHDFCEKDKSEALCFVAREHSIAVFTLYGGSQLTVADEHKSG